MEEEEEEEEDSTAASPTVERSVVGMNCRLKSD